MRHPAPMACEHQWEGVVAIVPPAFAVHRAYRCSQCGIVVTLCPPAATLSVFRIIAGILLSARGASPRNSHSSRKGRFRGRRDPRIGGGGLCDWLRLQTVEETHGFLRVGRGLHDAALVIAENFEPVGDIAGVIVTHFPGQVGLSAVRHVEANFSDGEMRDSSLFCDIVLTK